MIVVMDDTTRRELRDLILVIRSGDDVSDEQVWKLFLNFEIEEEEISGVVEELRRGRPELYKKLEDKLIKNKPS